MGLEIVIACGGLPFGPETPDAFALGGAETATLSLARELRLRGHRVTVFCPLPPEGREDALPSGALSAEGVRYVGIEHYAEFIGRAEVDLLIAGRDPALLAGPHQARRAVLWLHDLATFRRLRPALRAAAWRFDEAWCVSEFHRRQVHAVTEYPLDSIRVLRNGILRFPPAPALPREPRALLYAARPERGLERLVAPDGVMAALPEFRLRVCGYEMPGDAESAYYGRLRALCRDRPNVELVGPLAPRELRRLMARSWAYVYPTEFEEVSCILARECLEQGLPFVAPRVGALPETLGDAAAWASDPHAGFVEALRRLDGDPALWAELHARAKARTDLYWDEVAARVEELARPVPARAFSLAWSLRQDGDLLAARAVLAAEEQRPSPGLAHLGRELARAFPDLDRPAPACAFEPLLREAARVRPDWAWDDPGALLERFPGALAQGRLERLPPGARVLLHGCGDDGEALALAQALPDLEFAVIEPRSGVHAVACERAAALDLPNLTLHAGLPASDERFQALVALGPLEGLAEPWRALEQLERALDPGAGVTLVTHAGAGDVPGRVWNLDPRALRLLLQGKPGLRLAVEPRDLAPDGRLRADLVATYAAGGAPPVALDPLALAHAHRARQTCAAALIAMDSEQTLLQALASLRGHVQQLQVALGPSRDRTEALLRDWAERHPELDLRVRHVPRIEPWRFGFDDARHASLEGLEADWALWIDTDEFLTGAPLAPYLRPNALDAYQVHQHHFSTEPRGAPSATDTPARLVRNDGRMRFYGKVHEQAEKGPNGLAGFAMVLPDVDIAHVGYRDQATRRRRFERNRPFVDWDHAVAPERLVGKYIWLRDLVLRAELALERAPSDPQALVEARALAAQARDFYRAEWRSFEPALGGGRAFLGLAHATRARRILGEGVTISLVAQVEDEGPMRIEGCFGSEEEARELLEAALAPACARRLSRYWD